jgi:hypothetical protein
MSIVNKPYGTGNGLANGSPADATQVNADFDTIYNDYNGNITNDNISGSAGIVDTKLAQISTASKVSGAALTALGNTPSGAGTFPAVTLGAGATDTTTYLRGDMAWVTLETAWSDYSGTSTIVGWSAYTTKQIYIKKIGRTVFVDFCIFGTSNSQFTSFTVPYIPTGSPTYLKALCIGANSATALLNPSLIAGNTSNTAVYIYYDIGQATTWTNVGQKVVQGQYWYESV